MKEVHKHATSSIQNTINFQECEKHEQAHRFGKPSNLEERCQCCNYPISRQQIKTIFYKTEQVNYLGQGLSLYFKFITHTIILMLILSLGLSIYSLIQNVQGTSCISYSLNCSQNWTFSLSTLNNMNNPLQLSIQTYIIIGLCLFIILYNQVSNLVIRKCLSNSKDQYYSNDFAVLLRFTEKHNYSEKAITKMIEDWWNVQIDMSKEKKVLNIFNGLYADHTIQKILFCFDLQSFLSLTEEIQELQQQIEEDKKDQNKRSAENIKFLLSKIRKVQKLNEKIMKKEFQKTNKCIIIFKTVQIRNYFLKENLQGCSCDSKINELILGSQNYAKTYRAPFPQEIIYQNTHLPYSQKFKTRFLYNMASFFIICVFYGLLILFVYLWKEFVINEVWFPIIFALLICIMNNFSCFICLTLSSYEDHVIVSEFESKKAYKMVLIGFAQIVVLLLTSYIIFDPSYIWISNGFIDTVTYYFLFSIVIFHVLKFVNYSTISSFFHRKGIRNNKTEVQDQKQANTLFQKPKFTMYYEYGKICSFVLMTSFLSPLIPLSLPCVTFFVILQLWFQKLKLVHLCSQPQPSSDYLFFKMFNIIRIVPFCLSLGSLILNLIAIFNLNHEANALTISLNSIVTLLSLYFLFIPQCSIEASKYAETEYSQIKDKFLFDYDTQNPVYNYKIKNYPPISVISSKNEAIKSELNTMSKSLQQTLKNRLFKSKTVCLEELGTKRQKNDDDSYYQYEQKIFMPSSKPSNVPLLFKPSPKFLETQYEMQKEKESQKEKEKTELWQLFKEGQPEDEEAKRQFKEKIKKKTKLFPSVK